MCNSMDAQLFAWFKLTFKLTLKYKPNGSFTLDLGTVS